VSPTTPSPDHRSRNRLALVAAFVDAALRYWLTVFPRATRLIDRWQHRAAQIPDPVLRRLGVDSLRERSNIEGAAAFAAFAPRADRAAVVRALVAFQAAYNYADLLSEQPHEDAIANGRRLHEALLCALDPAAPPLDFYAYHPQRDDGGYFLELVDTCRAALLSLPSFSLVARSAQIAAERIVLFQSLNVGTTQGDHLALERWAREHTPPGSDLRWWETAAAAGSSLGVHVLIAAAAEPALQPADVAALEHAYFPWIGALHSLLDNIVDRREDVRTAQPSLVGYYASPAQTAARLQLLAVQAVSRARALPHGRRHLIILAAMAGNYLSNPEADAPDVSNLAHSVLDAIGDLATPTLLVFKLRRIAGGAGDRTQGSEPIATAAPAPIENWSSELQDPDTVRVPEV
jgi:tetraprenyl-beta-curcumene synthase